MPRSVYPWPQDPEALKSKRRCYKMAKYETMLITSAALDEEATSALVGARR